MCGTVKHEGMAKRIGQLIPVQNLTTNQVHDRLWTGFITEEKLWWWKQQSQLEYTWAKIDTFIEGKYTFTLPQRYGIVGYEVRRPVSVNGKLICAANSFRILTRAAGNDFEAKIHSRWPVARSSVYQSFDFGPHYWREIDVRQSAGQMPLLR